MIIIVPIFSKPFPLHLFTAIIEADPYVTALIPQFIQFTHHAFVTSSSARRLPFNLCDKKQKKEVCKFAKRMKKLTCDCNQVENPRTISTKKCKSLISEMVKDETHPLYPYITTLPRGHLRVPWSRTERFRKSFPPYAIKLFNSDWYKLGYKLH